MKKELKQSLYMGNIIDMRWAIRHVYNHWLNQENHMKCLLYLKFCYTCGNLFTANRASNLTCSSYCCKKLNSILSWGSKPFWNKKNIPTPTPQQLKSLGFDLKEKKLT